MSPFQCIFSYAWERGQEYVTSHVPISMLYFIVSLVCVEGGAGILVFMWDYYHGVDYFLLILGFFSL